MPGFLRCGFFLEKIKQKEIRMENQVIEEAIANIVSTSEALDRFCNDPKNYNSFGSQILEQMSWELHKQANLLREFKCDYGF